MLENSFGHFVYNMKKYNCTNYHVKSIFLSGFLGQVCHLFGLYNDLPFAGSEYALPPQGEVSVAVDALALLLKLQIFVPG